MGRPRLPTPEKYCERCGKLLERRPLKSGYLEPLFFFNQRKYCSLECANARKTWDELSGESVAWSREIARRKTPPSPCADCGKEGPTEVHHIDKDPFNNDPENLIRLCRSCHAKRHKIKSTCVICGAPMKGKGLCSKHYQQYRKGKLKLPVSKE